MSLRYHLAQLRALCRSHPLERKVVFVPSIQIGWHVEGALARAGVSWANLYVTTPVAWARYLAEPYFQASDRRPVPEDVELFFLQDAVRRLDQEGIPLVHGGYVSSALAKMFLHTIRALRMEEISQDAWVPDIDDRGHRASFLRVYEAYEAWMEREKWYDLADLYGQASRLPPGRDRIVAVFDEVSLPGVVHRFVQSRGEVVLRVGRPGAYEQPTPQHSALDRFRTSGLVGGGVGTIGPGGTLLSEGLDSATTVGPVVALDPAKDVNPTAAVDPTTTADPVANARIDLREATGMDNEVRGVLGELLKRGARLDEIEFVYTSEEPYLSLIVGIMAGLGLPASYASGVPATLLRAGQSVVGFYRWVASDCDPKVLVELLKGRLLDISRKGSTVFLAPSAVADTLLEAGVGPGRMSWRPALERFWEQLGEEAAGSDGRRAAYLENRQGLVGAAIEWLASLYALVPGTEVASLTEMAEAGLRFVKRFVITGRAESLAERLLEMKAGYTVSGEPQALARSMADLLSTHNVDVEHARPGHLYVVPLERAGYTGRKYTVVVGLSEATFPRVAMEDPILLDDERERISGGRLRLRRFRAGDSVWHLIRLLGMASADILLVANRRDLLEGRDMHPAALFEEFKKRLGGGPFPRYEIIPRLDHALGYAGIVMALRGPPSLAGLVVPDFPWLERGLEAVRGRKEDGFGPYDGWLGRETPELRPDASASLSASQLEALTACPYRYFLRYVLKVRAPDVSEEMPGGWLTPFAFGRTLHDVLYRFVRGIAERGERIGGARHDEHFVEMQGILQEVLSHWRERMPVRNELDYQSDVQRLEQAARIFLGEESRRRVRPVGFEVSFGRGEQGGLAVPDPVRLRLSEAVDMALSGSIDRVDELPGGFEVWDYKSGSARSYEEKDDLLAGGRHLQWALYAFVLDELLERSGRAGRTVRSGYFFPSDRGHGLRLGSAPPAREEVAWVLEPFFDLIERGACLHVQKHDACPWCDYRLVCGKEGKRGSAVETAMQNVRQAPFLDPLRRWMEVR